MMKLRCPKCKRPIMVMCLTSYPAKYECGCNSCGFALRYWDRKDNHKQITQEEVNEFYTKEQKMKVTVDMENLGALVQEAVQKNLNSLIENEVRKSIESKVAENARGIIETVVNEQLESYVKDYITTATVSVGGGWNSEPKTYTVEGYIKQQISDIMEKQGFRVKDRYGSCSSVTFEDYIKRELNVDASVQKALDQFMKKVKDDVNKNVTKMFDNTTQAALSSVIMNMLSNSNAFMEMRDNLKRITDGN